jgi:hypothetical protein
VRLDGLEADKQLGGNLRIGLPVHDERGDPSLALGEGGEAVAGFDTGTTELQLATALGRRPRRSRPR